MRIVLYVSLFLNLVFITFLAFKTHQRGGMAYIKQLLGIENMTTSSNYGQIKSSIFETLPIDSNSIVLIGNSLTDYGHWEEIFPCKNIKNRGIGGETIEDVIERIDIIAKSKPKKIFLSLGTNDLERHDDDDIIIKNYSKLVEKIISTTPETTIFVCSVLPTFQQPERSNERIRNLNSRLFEICSKFKLTYINLHSLFVNEAGEMNLNYSPDGIHLNGKGYEVWGRAIANYID